MERMKPLAGVLLLAKPPLLGGFIIWVQSYLGSIIPRFNLEGSIMSRFNQPGFSEPRFNEPGFSTPGTGGAGLALPLFSNDF